MMEVCPFLGGLCVTEQCAMWRPEKKNMYKAGCSFARLPAVLEDITDYLSDIVVDGIDANISGLVIKNDGHQ